MLYLEHVETNRTAADDDGATEDIGSLGQGENNTTKGCLEIAHLPDGD